MIKAPILWMNDDMHYQHVSIERPSQSITVGDIHKLNNKMSKYNKLW